MSEPRRLNSPGSREEEREEGGERRREKERGGEKRMGERRGRERGDRSVERRFFNQGEIMAGRTCDFIQSSYNQHTGSVLLHLFPNITDFILPAASCGREEGRGKGAAQCVQY